MASLQIDSALLKRASNVLNAVDNDFRLDILKVIHSNGSITVTKLCIQLHQDQASTSRHLRFLREAGIVNNSRKGKYIYYTIDYNSLEKMMDLISGLLKEPVNATIKMPAKLFLSDYKAYILEMIDVFKPIPQKNSYEGMQAWLKSFAQEFKAYHLAIEKKKSELLKEAKKEGEVDLEKLMSAMEETRLEGINAYIKSYKL